MDKYINYDSFLHLTRELLQSAEENIIMNPILEEENTQEYFFLQSRNREDFVGWILFDDLENRNFFHSFLYNFLQTKLEFKDLTYDIENFDAFYEALTNSYPSVFQVIESKQKKMILKDLILGEELIIDDPQLIISNEAECYLLRVTEFKGRNYIIQVFNSMSMDFTQVFMRNLWEYFRSDESAFHRESNEKLIPILKSEVMEIFFTYALSLQQYVELTKSLQDRNLYDAMMEGFFDPDDERYFHRFIHYLEKEKSKDMPDREEVFYHFSLIYESFLAPRELNFSSIEEIDFEIVYEKLCKMGEFSHRDELQTSIYLMKRFYELFSEDRHELLQSLERVSDQLFYYLKILQETLKGYYYDDQVVSLAKDYLETPPRFLYDFEYLLDFAQYDYLKMTTKGNIYPSLVRHLAGELDAFATKTDVQTLQIHHFPLLQILEHFSRIKEILYYDGESLELHPKSFRYLELPFEIKLGIWIETLLKDEFYKPLVHQKTYRSLQKLIAGYLYDLYTGKEVSLPTDYMAYFQILHRLEILESDCQRLTPFGYHIVRYFDQHKAHNKVIDLGSFQRQEEF